MSAPVTRITGIERTVADLARTEAFYRDGLGFARIDQPAPAPAALLQALGLPDAACTRLRMRLGEQEVAFLAFDPPGKPYPDAPLSTDPFFQHIAIPVRDMDAAMARLATVSWGRISEGGAQKLPEASGGVSAFKFRDPDGHPLELIFFPDGPSAEKWRDAPGVFLGIDHSAITVTDLDAALVFFESVLGLAVNGRSLNEGLEQGRLDGLPDPQVDVVTLAIPGAAGPHMELLHYRRPRTLRASPAPYGPRDRASTRFRFAAPEVAALADAARAAGYAAACSDDASTACLRGPDGHAVLLSEP